MQQRNELVVGRCIRLDEGRRAIGAAAVQPATRIADTPVAPPKGAALAAFAGRYWSDELESAMTIVQRGDSLFLRQRRYDDAPLTAAATAADTFEGRSLTLSFERDRNGEVIGFYAANGRTRDVRFGRLRP